MLCGAVRLKLAGAGIQFGGIAEFTFDNYGL